MENLQPGECPGCDGKLQFGHGGGAVENGIDRSYGLDWRINFNSATAVEPWRTIHWTKRSENVSELQFGHGGGAVENRRNSVRQRGADDDFNSATAVEPWRTAQAVKTHAVNVRLQFGHGGGAVENDTPRRPKATIHGDFNSATAVEPWRTCQQAVAQYRVGVTSIRPRRWSRGEPIESRTLRGTYRALQFGHGGGAVENRGRRSHNPGDLRNFNSATAVEPWRTHSDGTMYDLLWDTSIRPRRWSRGEPGGEGGGRPGQGDFNSATAVEPWRTTQNLSSKPFIRSLQFGHGGGAVENNPLLRSQIVAKEHFNSATAVEPWRTGGARGRLNPPC